MLCYFSTAHFLGNPSPKSSDPCPSPPHVLSGNTCALLAQAISESTSHTFTCKKLWIPLEVRHGTKFPRTCLESQCQATSWVLQASSPGCDSLKELRGPAWVQRNTAQHVQISAVSEGTWTRKICQVPYASNNSDVLKICFQDKCWMQETLGAGSEWPRLGWIWGTPTVRICLHVCVANHKLHIQP